MRRFVRERKTGERHFGVYVIVVGAMTALSRLLGLVREMLTSRMFGTGLEQSAFVFAFMIPNLFRRLFGEGALISAFVPVFRSAVDSGENEEARKLAGSVSGLILCVLGTAVVLIIAGITAALPVADGKYSIILKLTRIMIPYAMFICMAALGSGILNSISRFGPSSFAQNILNIMWISALLVLYFVFPEAALTSKILVVSWVVLAAGFAQCLFLFLIIWRSGFSFRFSFHGWFDGRSGIVARNMLYGAFGAGVVQVNLLADNALALYAAEWAPAAITYAERLVYLPLGVVATAFATVILNPLTTAFGKNDAQSANRVFAESAAVIMALMTPLSVFLAIYAKESVATVYSGAVFGTDSILRVSRALMFYAPGLLVFSMNKLVTPWFHSRRDVRTPTEIGVKMVILNLFLNCLAVFTLPREWKHAGIAGSTVFCSLCTFLMLSGLARRRENGGLKFGGLPWLFTRIAAASAIMATAAFMVRGYFAKNFAAAAAVGGGSFFGGAVFTGLKSLFFGGLVCLPVYLIAALAFCPELRTPMTAAFGKIWRGVGVK